MPKKPGPKGLRAHTAPSGEPRPRRVTRQLSRPVAAVPIGGAVPTRAAPPPTPTANPAVSGSRPSSGAGRLYRPARASSLPLIVDYRYVLADLKRIALLAAVAFAVLIGLTFVVH